MVANTHIPMFTQACKQSHHLWQLLDIPEISDELCGVRACFIRLAL